MKSTLLVCNSFSDNSVSKNGNWLNTTLKCLRNNLKNMALASSDSDNIKEITKK
jgi:hypothetical protein